MYPSIMMNLKTKKALHHIRAVLICLFLVIICLTLNPNPRAQGAGRQDHWQDYWRKGILHRFHGGEIRFSERETARPGWITAEPVEVEKKMA